MNDRAAIAAAANAAVEDSDRWHPALAADSTRETLATWLQCCDPNGSHTDDLATAEGMDPYDLDGAWEAVADMVAANA